MTADLDVALPGGTLARPVVTERRLLADAEAAEVLLHVLQVVLRALGAWMRRRVRVSVRSRERAGETAERDASGNARGLLADGGKGGSDVPRPRGVHRSSRVGRPRERRRRRVGVEDGGTLSVGGEPGVVLVRREGHSRRTILAIERVRGRWRGVKRLVEERWVVVEAGRFLLHTTALIRHVAMGPLCIEGSVLD